MVDRFHVKQGVIDINMKKDLNAYVKNSLVITNYNYL